MTRRSNAFCLKAPNIQGFENGWEMFPFQLRLGCLLIIVLIELVPVIGFWVHNSDMR